MEPSETRERYTQQLGRTMMRMLAVAAAIAALLLTTSGVSAAPLEQRCDAGGFPQADMAGFYVDSASPMRVEIYPCGAVFVMWDNPYGRHVAAYTSTNRLPQGGIAATGVIGPGPFLDDSLRIGFKPAEAGYLQVITLAVYDDTIRVYRLRKIA